MSSPSSRDDTHQASLHSPAASQLQQTSQPNERSHASSFSSRHRGDSMLNTSLLSFHRRDTLVINPTKANPRRPLDNGAVSSPSNSRYNEKEEQVDDDPKVRSLPSGVGDLSDSSETNPALRRGKRKAVRAPLASWVSTPNFRDVLEMNRQFIVEKASPLEKLPPPPPPPPLLPFRPTPSTQTSSLSTTASSPSIAMPLSTSSPFVAILSTTSVSSSASASVATASTSVTPSPSVAALSSPPVPSLPTIASVNSLFRSRANLKGPGGRAVADHPQPATNRPRNLNFVHSPPRSSEQTTSSSSFNRPANGSNASLLPVPPPRSYVHENAESKSKLSLASLPEDEEASQNSLISPRQRQSAETLVQKLKMRDSALMRIAGAESSKLNKSSSLPADFPSKPTLDHVECNSLASANSKVEKIDQNVFFSYVTEPVGISSRALDAEIRKFLLNITDPKIKSVLMNKIFPKSSSSIPIMQPLSSLSVGPKSIPKAAAATISSSNQGHGSTSPPSSCSSSSSSSSFGFSPDRKELTADNPSTSEDMTMDRWATFEDEEEEDEKDLIMMIGDNDIPIIKGGTVDKLIERLTYEKYPDPDYLGAFLLTYRSFTAPAVLLTKMIQRFETIAPHTNLDNPEYVKYFHEKKTRPVQIRTCNAIKRWVKNYWYDFEGDPMLVDQLTKWLKESLLFSSDGAYVSTAFSLEKIIAEKLSGSLGPKTIAFYEKPPPPIRPKGNKIWECDPTEVARQISLIEFQDFAAIQPKECLNQAWTKSSTSIHICNMIKRSNAFSKWLVYHVLHQTEGNIRLRAKMIKFFVVLAKELRKLNNFNGVMEILSGLGNTAVYRMKKTWELLEKKHTETYEELRDLMKPHQSWKIYRSVLKNCNPPCIPYLGVYLTDLTFIDDGNSNVLNDVYINFFKCRQQAVVIRDIQQYQQCSYCFEKVEEIREILDLMMVFQFPSEEDFFTLSLQLEPRDPKAN